MVLLMLVNSLNSRAADVVAVAGGTVRDDLFAVHFLDLIRLERLDHAGLFGHAAYPLV